MQTFEEYWSRGLGFDSLAVIDAELAEAVAATCYAAGQASASKWFNEELKRRSL